MTVISGYIGKWYNLTTGEMSGRKCQDTMPKTTCYKALHYTTPSDVTQHEKGIPKLLQLQHIHYKRFLASLSDKVPRVLGERLKLYKEKFHMVKAT